MALLVPLLAVGACRGGPRVRLEAMHVLPPADGECVGSVEVVAVNEGRVPVSVGRLSVRLPDERSDTEPPMGTNVRGLVSIEPVACRPLPLAPGASCVLRKDVVRTEGDLTTTFEAGARVPVFDATDPGASLRRSEAEAPDVAFDLARWPVADPLTRESLDRALAEGRGVYVRLYDVSLPSVTMRDLEVRTDGQAQGVASYVGDGLDVVWTAGSLDAAQRAALVDAIRAAPLDAFRADPEWEHWFDGHRIRLVIAAGRSACVLSSMAPDFTAAGLDPLLDRLRALILELPRK